MRLLFGVEREERMSKRITWRANALICIIIILGFSLTSYISYHSNREAFEQDAERVSILTSEGIASEINTQFNRPIDVSLTMANDSLLKGYLNSEQSHIGDSSYEESLREYLEAYREKYGFDSVFLVSSATKRYYHFNGIDRTLDRGNPENNWYYAFLDSADEYALNIDNDEATNNEITVFVNCRILNDDGSTQGIVGVDFRIDNLRALFSEYEKQTATRAYLVNIDGFVEVSTDIRGEEKANLFADSAFSGSKIQALDSSGQRQSSWYSSSRGSGYLVSQYMPYLNWSLIVDHDTSELDAQIAQQFAVAIFVITVVITLVLVATTSIFRRYNRLMVQQAAAVEQERKTVFQEAAEQLYDNIYEVDVTHDCAANDQAQRYFESFGAKPETPFSEVLVLLARHQVKEEFRQQYLEMFLPESVLAAYRRGEVQLVFDFPMTTDGENYSWARINAHLFIWSEDNSVHMLVYRQNIDEEKRREHAMIEQMQRDPLTGLYNKGATQERIHTLLAEMTHEPFAFLILDIDDFKSVNDRFGHGVGDAVLSEFAQIVSGQFHHEDVVGRIGGDEFVAFVPMSGVSEAKKKATELMEALCKDVVTDSGVCRLSASLGIALTPPHERDFETLYRHADRALYRAKALGKNRFVIDGDRFFDDDDKNE